MKLWEIASPIEPQEKEDVIRRSFDDTVVSDLLADVAQKEDLVDSKTVVESIRKKFPQLKDVELEISKDADRVRIYFSEDGKGEKIILPTQLKKGLGEVLVLHEIAHMLYTKDLLTNKILKHRAGPQAFTIMRVLEDIAIEKRLEAEYPEAVEVFKSRAQHIMPVYKQHTPTDFASDVDQLFLHLRGYSKAYKGDPYVLRYAQQYLENDDDETKIDAILNITSKLTGKG